MSHTDGPWVHDGYYLIKTPYGLPVACIMWKNHDPQYTVTQMSEIHKANAALVAAAPDLLAACKYAVANHFNIVTFGKLERAIAKAEGKP